jgi:GTPase SAR1 family protein
VSSILSVWDTRNLNTLEELHGQFFQSSQISFHCYLSVDLQRLYCRESGGENLNA